jgi:hypothetical protein
MSKVSNPIIILLLAALALAACAQATPVPTALPTEPLPPAPSPTSPPVETSTPEPLPGTAEPGADLESFVIQLIEALDAKDFAALQSLMGDPFIFGFWLGEGASYTPEQAVEQLRTNYLGTDTDVVVDRDLNLSEILGGADPQTIAGPVPIASAFFVDGWGLTGEDEAIIFIARSDDGSYYWHSALVAGGGFSAQGLPEQGVVETEVQYVRPVSDVNIYNQPDVNAGVIGLVAGGQTALVTGASPDGAWWRVVCPDGSVGSCWVPSAQALPAEAP